MIRMTPLFAVVAALLCSTAMPSVAQAGMRFTLKGSTVKSDGPKKLNLFKKAKGKIAIFSQKHGELALGHLALGTSATFSGYVANGVPFKIAAGTLAIAAFLNGVGHGVAWLADKLRIRGF